MSRTFGKQGPAFATLGRAAAAVCQPLLQTVFTSRGFFGDSGRYARQEAARLRAELARGRPIYLAGIGVSGHNSGVALVEVTSSGVRTVANHEEERYTGIKHYGGFPNHSVAAALADLRAMNVAADVDGWLSTWSYPHYL